MKSSNNHTHEHSILGMVSVNEKGQIVIPAEARSLMDLKAGDRLLVIAHPSKDGISLMKPDGLESYAKSMLEKITTAKRTFKG